MLDLRVASNAGKIVALTALGAFSRRKDAAMDAPGARFRGKNAAMVVPEAPFRRKDAAMTVHGALYLAIVATMSTDQVLIETMHSGFSRETATRRCPG